MFFTVNSPSLVVKANTAIISSGTAIKTVIHTRYGAETHFVFICSFLAFLHYVDIKGSNIHTYHGSDRLVQR